MLFWHWPHLPIPTERPEPVPPVPAAWYNVLPVQFCMRLLQQNQPGVMHLPVAAQKSCCFLGGRVFNDSSIFRLRAPCNPPPGCSLADCGTPSSCPHAASQRKPWGRPEFTPSSSWAGTRTGRWDTQRNCRFSTRPSCYRSHWFWCFNSSYSAREMVTISGVFAAIFSWLSLGNGYHKIGRKVIVFNSFKHQITLGLNIALFSFGCCSVRACASSVPLGH